MEGADLFTVCMKQMFGMSKAVGTGAGTTNTSAPVENSMSRPATSD
jgi:hypothetical protein